MGGPGEVGSHDLPCQHRVALRHGLDEVPVLIAAPATSLPRHTLVTTLSNCQRRGSLVLAR